MESHHLNFLNEEDIRKQLGFEKPLEKKYSQVRTVAPNVRLQDLEMQKQSFEPGIQPDWAKEENSTIVWDSSQSMTMVQAVLKLRINLSETPIANYKPTLVDNWILYKNGYIARHNAGASEIRKVNDDKRKLLMLI